MRILSLGFPMPGPPLDNHSFASAPSFFDYDALVVDPTALSQLIEAIADSSAEHMTRSGERVVNGPSGPGAVGLAGLLRDRHDETARLLARGGVVVCFAHPNLAHRRVDGYADCDRYCWLPAPEGLRYAEQFLRRGDGVASRPDAHNHPFGPFLTKFSGRLAYHAYFDDASIPGAVFARSAGGAAIAIELSVGDGHVVFLPPPARPLNSDERYEISTALQAAIRQMLRLGSASAAPYWVGDYPLPGLAERIAASGEANSRLTEAEATLDEREAALDELNQYRRLLWQEGRFGLEDGVRAALALLGFQVYPQGLHEPAQIALPGDRTGQRCVALLEVDASEESVGMEGHHRLRQRLEEAIAQGKPARGVLIISGYRRTPPAERPQQHDDALRVAAERLRYCVVTTEQLFHAVRAALEGDETTVRAFRERLLVTEGVLQQD